MIRLKSLLTEYGVHYEDIPKEFPKRIAELDQDIKVIQEKKKQVQDLKREWTKMNKVFDEWASSSAKSRVTKGMREEDIMSMMRDYEERMQEAGVLKQYVKIEV